MVQTRIHRAFGPVKSVLPTFAAKAIRNTVTAFYTPFAFSWNSGHFKSSFKQAAVTRNGAPLPWYTYPCIDFLNQRNFENKRILEFGGGQSTLWWATRSQSVATFEDDQQWFERIKGGMPGNVDLTLITAEGRDECVRAVDDNLQARPDPEFDVVIIDGLPRGEMIPLARKVVSKSGAIICDNAEGYGFQEGFADSGLMRVDFFGYTPGGVLPHCTSIFFGPSCFLFESTHAIPAIALAA